MRKTFSCGHKGKGKFCHQCKNAERTKAREAEAPATLGSAWRNILELTGMTNNWEWVVHTNRQLTWEEVNERKLPIRTPNVDFSPPHLVVSRPVTDYDLKAGLDTRYWGEKLSIDTRGEKTPPVTNALDELHKLYQHLDIDMNKRGMPLPQALSFIITYNFYDCMSGGCSHVYLSALRMIIERERVPLDTALLDEKNTLGDFLREIRDVPRFEHLLGGDVPLLQLPTGSP